MPSYGFEISPQFVGKLSETVRSSADHFQLTIPGEIAFSAAMELRERCEEISKPLVLHSNFLNCFSENRWDELARVARQIRKLNPVMVVEHFTSFLFRGEKRGVVAPTFAVGSGGFQEACDRISRWRDLVGVPVSLENTPVTENVPHYWDLLKATRDRVGCGITCDFPHFIISAVAAQFTEEDLKALAASLQPRQVHLAGLDTQQGRLYDGHHLPSDWVAGYAKSIFASPEFFTFEQPPHLDLQKALARFEELKNLPPSSRDGSVWDLIPFSVAETNARLSEKTFSSLRPVKGSAVQNAFSRVKLREGAALSALSFFNHYQTFFWPLQALEEFLVSASDPDAIRSVAQIAKNVLAYQSWWAPNSTLSCELTYSLGETQSFSVTLDRGQPVVSPGRSKDFRGPPAFEATTCTGASIVLSCEPVTGEEQ